MCNEGLQCDVEWRYGIQKEVVVGMYVATLLCVGMCRGWVGEVRYL